MISCPAPNNKQVKFITDKYTKDIALYMHIVYGENLDSMNESYISNIIHNLQQNYDEDFFSDVSNITSKVVGLMDRKEILLTTKYETSAQKKVIDQFIEIIDEDIKGLNELFKAAQKDENFKVNTISATNFIGKLDYSHALASTDTFFADFGNFIHNYLDSILQEGVDKIQDKKFFEKFLEKFREKTPLVVKGLTDSQLHDVAKNIALKIHRSVGSVFIPEVNIWGTIKDKRGRTKKIRGIIDAVIIDPTGKVEIIDFKNKKLFGIVTKNENNEMITNNADIYSKLAINSHKVVQNDMSPFSGKEMTIMSQWLLQLRVYENMLEQFGIDVSKSGIIAHVYQMNDKKVYEGGVILDYLESTEMYAHALAYAEDNDGNIIEIANKQSEAHIKIIDDLISIDKPTEKQVKKKKEIFTPTKTQIEKLIEPLKNNIESNIQDAKNEIQNTDKDDVKTREILANRIKNLERLSQIIESAEKNDTLTDVHHSIMFSQMVNEIITEVNDIKSNILKLYESNKNILDKLIYDYKALTSKDYLYINDITGTMRDMWVLSQSYSSAVKALLDILNESKESEGYNSLKEQVDTINNDIIGIESQYMQQALVTSTIPILLGITPEVAKKSVSEVSQGYRLRVDKLKRELEKIHETGKVRKNVLKQIKQTIFSALQQDRKDEFKSSLNSEEQQVANRIEEIQNEIADLEAKIQGFDYADVKNLMDLIQNTNNYSAINHLLDTLHRGYMSKGQFSEGGFQAAVSNPNFAVAAMALYLKRLQSAAMFNSVNDTTMQALSRKSQEIIRKMGGVSKIVQLNDMMFEWVQVPFYDKTSNSIQHKERYKLRSIFSNEYAEKYKNFEYNVRIARSIFNEAKLKYNEELKDSPNREGLKAELDVARESLNQARLEQRKFIYENTNKPYIDAFYELELKIPQEYAQEIEAIRYENENILYESEDINILDDADLDMLIKNNARILEIKEKAKREDPEYAKSIDEYNQLFEYQENDRYFESRKKSMELLYANEPEKYEKWLSQNQVSRPKSEFWDTYSELMEERQAVVGSNPTIQALYKERRSLLAPYKVNGQMMSKLMPDYILQKVNEIDSKISETISLMRKDNLLDEFQYQELARIKNKINTIADKKLSDYYSEEKDIQSERLEKAYNVAKSAQSKYELNQNDKSYQESISATELFLGIQEEFKQWFDKNHVKPYKNNIYQGIDNVFKDATIRDFNYSIVPIDENMMETVGHPRNYSRPRLKLNNWTMNGVQLKQHEIYEIKKQHNWKSLIENGTIQVGQGVANPNYIQPIDGIMLPKGVYQKEDGTYGIEQGYENSPNINQDVVRIMNNEDYNEIYELIHKVSIESNKRTGTQSTYSVPALSGKSIDNLQRYNIKGMTQRQLKIFADKQYKLDSEINKSLNEFGEIKTDKIHHIKNPNNQLNRNLQSEDGIQAFLEYGAESHVTEQMSGGANIAKSMTDYLKIIQRNLETTFTGDNKSHVEMKKRAAKLSDIVEKMEYEQRKLLFGQYDNTQYKKLKKQIDLVFQYVSLIRIGFDVANQIKNYTAGSVQQFIAAGHSGDHYGRSNWFNAYKIFTTKFMPAYFKDYGKIADIDLMTAMYRAFNPLQKEISSFTEGTSAGASRRLASTSMDIYGLGYLTQDRGDTTIAVITMLSVLDNYTFNTFDINNDGEKVYRLDENGDIIKVKGHEVYYMTQDGQLQIRPDVEYNEDQQDYLRRVTISEMRRAQGNYAKADQTRIEENVIGRMAFFFRKYLVPLMRNRFGNLKPSWETGEAAYGYWRALASAFKHFGFQETLKEYLIGSRLLNRMGKTGLSGMAVVETSDTKDVPNLYVRKIAQARRDTVAMAMLAIASMMALSFLKQKQDDDEEIGMIEGNIIRILWGTRGEALGVFPVGPGGDEYIRNFTTAIPFEREFMKTKGTFMNLWYWTLAQLMHSGVEFDENLHSDAYERIYKKAYYQGKSMPFVKGDAKIKKNLSDMTGIKNIRDLFQPENRLEQMKRFVQL